MDDFELLYSATVRCRCGAGLAYPLDSEKAMAQGAWICGAALKDEQLGGEHDAYSFREYKVREETSINNRGGHSTRPAGTIARTVGHAVCPVCAEEWMSEPYDACGRGHHWFSGPCPNCGYAVAAAGSWSSDEGKPIQHRYHTVVLAGADGGDQRGN